MLGSAALLWNGVAVAAGGDLDTEFGDGGITRVTVGGGGQALDVARQPDGRYVVAGTAFNDASDLDFALARFTGDGRLDPTWSEDGQVITQIGGRGYDEEAFAVALQPDGRVVAAGFVRDDDDLDFAVARYGNDGTLDPTFGANGRVTVPFGPGEDLASALAIDPRGRIVAAGQRLRDGVCSATAFRSHCCKRNGLPDGI